MLLKHFLYNTTLPQESRLISKVFALDSLAGHLEFWTVLFWQVTPEVGFKLLHLCTLKLKTLSVFNNLIYVYSTTAASLQSNEIAAMV